MKGYQENVFSQEQKLESLNEPGVVYAEESLV